ncbi:MAG: hypothetical protein M3R71_03850 [Actinomycetota bacterium]|nr:hypothetical protein [Actinomycetota bacterium]
MLARPGWVVLRYGWDDVVRTPDLVAKELRFALGLGGGEGRRYPSKT